MVGNPIIEFHVRRADRAEEALAAERAKWRALAEAIEKVRDDYTVVMDDDSIEYHSIDCTRWERGAEERCDCAIGGLIAAYDEQGEG